MTAFPASQQALWPVSYNNRIVGYGDRSDNWLLQTPDCWGDAQCANSAALQRYTDTIRADIASDRTLAALAISPGGLITSCLIAAGFFSGCVNIPPLSLSG
ncbi:hypothetical protein [Bacterioplanoides pacificum]|uniref:Uncharacterized protein n=1 Tax=Bacterioplanoides pacificum TaxID=1171596 RepID=A0ABV7VRS8_9GAMM